MRIDLHVHSNSSDGTDDPAEVIRRAAGAGVDVVALTDHDTVAGWDEARAALPPGLALVPGMELSCQLDGRSVHLLSYLFDPAHAELARETDLIRDDRTHRAKGMVRKLNELGANVSWDLVARIADGAVVGRPHIARAMAQAHVIDTPADAFTDEWIGDGGRAFVERYAITLGRAVRLVRQAGGVPVLAHPRSPGYEIPDDVIARLAAEGLAGIEVNHPDHDDSQRSHLTALARDVGLLTTGGSDDHGSFTPSSANSVGPGGGTRGGIGSETTPDGEYEKLVAQAGTAPPGERA